MNDYKSTEINKNDCLKYAVARNLLYRKGKNVETLVSYEPAMVMFSKVIFLSLCTSTS